MYLVPNPAYYYHNNTVIPLNLIALITCILSISPVVSILLATLTAFPQMSYCGLRAPITPATTGPMLIPALPSHGKETILQEMLSRLQ